MFEISSFGKLLSTFSHSYHLNDTVDRLHWNITTVVLILCVLFIGAEQQFGQPIQCMLPTHLDRNSWTDYGQYYCFTQNTYRLTNNQTLPNASNRAELHLNANVNYYQWVPFFLTIQALCFYIPGWLWMMLQHGSIFDMEAIVREAICLKTIFKFEGRVTRLTNLVNYIASGLKMKMNTDMCKTECQMSKSTSKSSSLKAISFIFQHIFALNLKNSNFKWCKHPLDEKNGISTALYLISKLLNVINNIMQLYIIGRFIGFSNFPLAKQFTSSYFPLITFCDIERQTLGKVEINTLQCVLMLNFINEKIFFMLWYWISLLFVLSLTDFIITLVQCLRPQCREALIKFYLQGGEFDDKYFFLLRDERYLHIYIMEFLGLDGVLLLRFINNHAGIKVTQDITVGLWHCFCGFYQIIFYHLFILSIFTILSDSDNINNSYSL
uniref:Innexin n=1 Tax=Wuchereria bancrofti TaxID=6293 RepID=A0AAF5Q2G7_WUCBA